MINVKENVKDSFRLTEQLNDLLVELYSHYFKLKLKEIKSLNPNKLKIEAYQKEFDRYYQLTLDNQLFASVEKMQNKIDELLPFYNQLNS